jgi:hypothetical protein
MVTALVIGAVCGATGLFLWLRRQRRQRAERARHEHIRSVLAGWLPSARLTVDALCERIEREHYEEDHHGLHGPDQDCEPHMPMSKSYHYGATYGRR